MIHNISRHYSKLLCLKSKANNRLPIVNLGFSIISACQGKFLFATQNRSQKNEESRQDAFSPIDYYRNRIRRVNIKSNGKGKFSPYSLQKIINMSRTQQHAKIMFEAYYNYLGHFTLIPNNVVDSLVFRSIQIGNQVEQLLQIFANHNYLTYFPHYDATNRFIKHLIKTQNNQGLQKLLRVLLRSPLIKINAKTVNILTQNLSAENCQVNVKQITLKLLLFRRKLVHEVNQEDLLSKISAALQKSETGPFQAKALTINRVNELLNEASVSTEDTVNRLILASTLEMIAQSGNVLAKTEQQLGTEYERYFNYLGTLASRSTQQINYGSTLKQTLAEAKLSLSNAQKIEQIINGSA